METKPVAYVFPGQGSQSVGMGRELAHAFPAAMEMFVQADSLLGFSLSKICWQGSDNDLNDTINTQPALFVHSIASLRVLQSQFPALHPRFVAGHSMGELSALVAAGSLSFAEGLKLTRIRGELMKRAGEVAPGGMAAILGLDIATLERLCREASTLSEVVQVANDNCPGQVVISGANAALERALPLIQAAGARRAVRLAVSIAAHSPLMTHAQSDFNQAVVAAPLLDPSTPLIGNVTAQPLASADAIRSDLQDQLTHRVRWTESVQFMASQGVTQYFEVGNGTVLAGLIKRIDRLAGVQTLAAPADFEKLFTG